MLEVLRGPKAPKRLGGNGPDLLAVTNSLVEDWAVVKLPVDPDILGNHLLRVLHAVRTLLPEIDARGSIV